MRVAITGATGFIGRHVLRELSSRPGIAVTATARGERPPNLPDGTGYLPLDIASPPADAYEQLGRPDVLVHLAWSGLPNYRSLHHFASELPHQYAFLCSLVEAGLPSLLVTGTCYESGMPSGEWAEPVAAPPANPYAYAKTALRQQLEFLRVKQPFQLTWTRLFYMYGDGQPATSLYPQLAAAVARGDATFAMSHGEQLRDYLPVEQVARHIADLALRGAGAGIVNVCSGRPVSVRSLVMRWLAERGWRIALDLGKYPYPDYEPMAFWGHPGKLRALLDGAAER